MAGWVSDWDHAIYFEQHGLILLWVRNEFFLKLCMSLFIHYFLLQFTWDASNYSTTFISNNPSTPSTIIVFCRAIFKYQWCIVINLHILCMIHVTDKVWDFVEENCYPLNCILMLLSKPWLYPKKVNKARVKLLFI